MHCIFCEYRLYFILHNVTWRNVSTHARTDYHHISLISSIERLAGTATSPSRQHKYPLMPALCKSSSPVVHQNVWLPDARRRHPDVDLQTKVCEFFTITEKAISRAFYCHLKCENTSRPFHLGEGPRWGLSCNCEIFANLRLKLYPDVLHLPVLRLVPHQVAVMPLLHVRDT